MSDKDLQFEMLRRHINAILDEQAAIRDKVNGALGLSLLSIFLWIFWVLVLTHKQ